MVLCFGGNIAVVRRADVTGGEITREVLIEFGGEKNTVTFHRKRNDDLF